MSTFVKVVPRRL